MAIGGYFGLELKQGMELHNSAIKLNTGRNALEVILRTRRYDKVYLPYYICDSVLTPFERLGVEYCFYHIDDRLEPVFDFDRIANDHALLYCNYFGMKDSYAFSLNRRCNRIIIDNCQAFFSAPFEHADTFYSARKFFGVPDGAYLYLNEPKQCQETFEHDRSHQRCTHLLKRLDLSPEDGYEDFLHAEECLNIAKIRRMSSLTERLLGSIDYRQKERARRDNFMVLHGRLGDTNLLQIDDWYDFSSAPLTYPLLLESHSLRSALIANGIYVPQFWCEVLNRTTASSFEHRLANSLLPLPIDHRYDTSDMSRVADTIARLIEMSSISN